MPVATNRRPPFTKHQLTEGGFRHIRLNFEPPHPTLQVRGVLRAHEGLLRKRLVWVPAAKGDTPPASAALFRLEGADLNNRFLDQNQAYLKMTNEKLSVDYPGNVGAGDMAFPCVFAVANPEYPDDTGTVTAVADRQDNLAQLECGGARNEWIKQKDAIIQGAYPSFQGLFAGLLIFNSTKIETRSAYFKFGDPLAVGVGEQVDNGYAPCMIRNGLRNKTITTTVPYICFVGTLSQVSLMCIHPETAQPLYLAGVI